MSIVHPLVAPWGRFLLRSFYIDAPRPAIIDTGVTESPARMAEQLRELGKDVADVRWILLTHGHIDHMGGTTGLYALTGEQAEVVIHEADVPFLQSREAHVQEWRDGRGRWLTDPEGEAHEVELLRGAIDGEMDPTVVVRGGETLDLGDGIEIRVHAIPGHTEGAVAYQLDGDVFVGDAVQSYGAASGFPGYEDPDRYRASLEYLRDVVQPERLYLGHPYRRQDGTPFPEVLGTADAREAIQGSIDNEARIRAAFLANPAQPSDSPYSPFAAVAEELGYTGDPTQEPAPFFTTMNAYVTLFGDENGRAS